MFSSSLTALTIILTALGASAGVVERQDATPATTLTAVDHNGKVLGVSVEPFAH